MVGHRPDLLPIVGRAPRANRAPITVPRVSPTIRHSHPRILDDAARARAREQRQIGRRIPIGDLSPAGGSPMSIRTRQCPDLTRLAINTPQGSEYRLDTGSI